MSLVKTSLLNGIAVFIKMLSLFGINKVLAVLVGPSGYAIVGQFQNLVQMLTTFSSGAVTTGVTKYTAEKKDDLGFIHGLWKTAGTISIIGSLITGTLLVVFSRSLSLYFLKDENYQNVFYWLAGSLIFFVFNSFLLSIMNGKKEIKIYVAANISGSLLSLISVYIFSSVWGLEGSLIALAVYQSIAFVVTFFLILRQPWFQLSYLAGAIQKQHLIGLSHFTLMSLAAAVCVPSSHLFVRSFLIERLSPEAAGEWEGLIRLSSAYLMFLTTTLSVYFLPRMSEIKTKKETVTELNYILKYLIPGLVISICFIYFFRNLIISVLFSDKFIFIEQLIGIQLIGDFFKMLGWTMGYILIARGLAKEFVISEVLFSLTFIAFSYYAVDSMGLIGMSYAHLLNYIFYALYLFYRLKMKDLI